MHPLAMLLRASTIAGSQNAVKPRPLTFPSPAFTPLESGSAHDHPPSRCQRRPPQPRYLILMLLHLFAIDHNDAGMDETLLDCYADLPPREAALAFGSDYDLERDDALWPRLGVPM